MQNDVTNFCSVAARALRSAMYPDQAQTTLKQLAKQVLGLTYFPSVSIVWHGEPHRRQAQVLLVNNQLITVDNSAPPSPPSRRRKSLIPYGLAPAR